MTRKEWDDWQKKMERFEQILTEQTILSLGQAYLDLEAMDTETFDFMWAEAEKTQEDIDDTEDDSQINGEAVT